MDAIRPVTTRLPSISAVAEIRPVSAAAGIGETEARALQPAASVDLSGDAAASSIEERQGYVRDDDSRSIVFQVTDALSGDVIVQIPDATVLKARVYARQDAAPVGEQVAKRA